MLRSVNAPAESVTAMRDFALSTKTSPSSPEWLGSACALSTHISRMSACGTGSVVLMLATTPLNLVWYGDAVDESACCAPSAGAERPGSDASAASRRAARLFQ